MRLLATARLKRACTAETWPAAVLTLRNYEAASILAVYPNKVRSTLDRLKMVASISALSRLDLGSNVWVISIANYAKYQKLGRPTSAKSYAELSDPPYVPTSLRPLREEEESAPSGAAAVHDEVVEVDSPKSGDRGLVLVERPMRKRAAPEVPPEAAAFAEDFVAALVRVHGETFKRPTQAEFVRWLKNARLMFAADKRPLEEARALARWLFTATDEGAEFWRTVVLSVEKFRVKYDQLAIKARAAHGRNGAAHQGSALIAWANE